MNDNENVPKIVEALQHHQLKKVLERAKAGKELTRTDLHLVEQIGSKFDASRTPPVKESAPQKPKRGRPTKIRQIVARVERQGLEQLLERQSRGEKLTGAEYTFLERMKQSNMDKAASKKKTLPAKLPLSDRLQASKEAAFESLCCVMEHSKSHMARVQAAQAVKEWAAETEPLPEPLTFVRINPEDLRRKNTPLPDFRGN